MLGAGTKPTLRARYGTRDFGTGVSPAQYYGLGVETGLGGKAVRLDFLYSSQDDCAACTSYGLSLGVVFPIYSPARKDVSGIEASIIPGFGAASADDDETSLVTATVEVPVNLRLNAGNVVVRPFVSPGYGFGMYEDPSVTESGALPFDGYGIAIAGARWEASIGKRQVVLEDLPDVLGFSFALRF